MGSIALMSGLGAGMTTLGQGIDKQFQMKMEQQRLQSLQDLETRKMDILERGQESETAYRKQSLENQTGEAYDKAKAQFQARMDATAEKIAANLPDEAQAQMTATLLKNVMRDGELMLNYIDPDTNEIDFATLGEAVSDAAKGMNIPGVLNDEQAHAQITRFAGSMVKEWNTIRQRFPEYASELSVADVIDQIPAFYGTVMSEKEKEVQRLHRQAQGYTPPPAQAGGNQGGLMDTPPPSAPSLSQQVADEGGLMSAGGFKAGYEGLSRAIYEPWFREFEDGTYANPDIPLLPMLSGETVGKLKSGYRNMENSVSRFLFGDKLGGMTRGPDGQLHYPENQPNPNTVTIDPTVKDDYSFR